MRLRSLHLQNWLLFADSQVSFDGVGNVIGVVGEYADEAVRSNRSGKSTLTEAIPYLFYGRGRGKQLQLINRSASDEGEDMLVTGVIALADGREITIKRGRTMGNKPILEVEGLEGAKVADADEHLAELIGFDRVEYASTCFFEQGDIHAFMAAQPAEKRALIQRWLRQDRWIKRQQHAHDKARELRTETEGYKLALQSLPTVAASIATLQTRVKEAAKKHKRAKERLDESLASRDEARERLSKVEKDREAYERLDKLELKFDRAREQLTEARRKSKARQKAESVRNRTREAWTDLKAEVELRSSELLESVTEKRVELSALTEKVKELSGLKGVCPFLETECDRVGNETVKPMEKTAKGIKCHLTTLQDSLDEYRRQQNAALKELQGETRKAERTIKDNAFAPVSHFRDALKELESEAEAVSMGVTTERHELDSAIEGIEAELSSMRTRINLARDQNDEASGEVAYTKSELWQAQKAAQRRTELEAKLAQAEKDKACWAYCQYMFGSRGIPGAIMESNFAALEADINFILERMNTNLSTRFLPYRETQKWEPTCVACGWTFEATKQRECKQCKEARQRKRVDQLILQVVDEYEGQVSEFGLDSGGGKTLLSFAVRLALMFMKVRESTGDIPPVVLDEVLADLDPINRAAVLDMVTNVLVRKFGVQQVFVISHQAETQEAIEDVLLVTRHNYHSEVAWA